MSKKQKEQEITDIIVVGDNITDEMIQEKVKQWLSEEAFRMTFRYREVNWHMVRRTNFDCFAAAAVRACRNTPLKNVAHTHLYCPKNDIGLEAYFLYYDFLHTNTYVKDSDIQFCCLQKAVHQANLVIAYAKDKSGIAYALCEYAKEIGVKVINLASAD